MPHVRTQHPNASLTPLGRRKMVACVLDRGWTIEATAERFQVDAKTVRKWRDRYLVRRRARVVRPLESTAPVAERDTRVVSASDRGAAQASVVGVQPTSVTKSADPARRCRRSFTAKDSAGSIQVTGPPRSR